VVVAVVTSPREVSVTGFVTRHQVRQRLRVSGVTWVEEDLPGDAVRFRFDADDDLWEDVQEWVEKVTG